MFVQVLQVILIENFLILSICEFIKYIKKDKKAMLSLIIAINKCKWITNYYKLMQLQYYR